MKDTKFLFSSCAVKSLENSLIDASVFEQLIMLGDYDAVQKFLIEKGFSGFESSSVPETALKDYVSDTYGEICEILGENKHFIDFLVIKNDFHNLKAALKLQFEGKEGENFFISPSLFNADEIFDCVKKREFSSLPSVISQYGENGWKIITDSQNGQKLEVYLDKAALDTSYELAEKTENDYCKEIVLTENTLINLKTAYRMSSFPVNVTVIEEALCRHANTDNEILSEAAQRGQSAVYEYICETCDEELVNAIKQGFSDFEKACDRKLNSVIEKSKYIPFGIETVVGYYLSKLAEYKNLIKITSYKKAGFSGEYIHERITLNNE